MIIDDRGVTGQVSVAGLLSLDRGNLDGWAFSVDDFTLSIISNRLAGGGFSGFVHVPILDDGQGEFITEEDCLRYSAYIESGDVYRFSVEAGADIKQVDIWLGQAEIYGSSRIDIQYKDDSFHALATLDGKLNIDGNLNDHLQLAAPNLYFQGVQLSNKAPYFSPGYWQMPDAVGARFGNFGLTVGDIGLVGTGDSTEVAMKFEALIRLVEDDIDVAAGGGFRLIGRLEEQDGRQRWKFDRFQVDDLLIDAGLPGVEHLFGLISFYEQDAIYGTGFRGLVEARFQGVNAEIAALAQFGQMPDYRYFLIDALAVFDHGIDFGGLKLKGFGGGAYYHMERDSSFALHGIDPVLPPLGTSLSGIGYTPNGSKGLGLKATVALSTSAERLFSANATLEMLFNEGKGLSDIWFYGSGVMLDELDPTIPPFFSSAGGPPPIDSDIAAFVDMHYNFGLRTFDANLKVYVNAQDVLVGVGDYGLAGEAQLHFDPNKWFINIGTPDQRIGLRLRIPGLNTDLIRLQSYLNAGTDISPMPELPAYARQITGASSFLANRRMRASGAGFAFGSSLEINTDDLNFLIFYASLRAGMGFDLMLRDYGDALCSHTNQPLGINGWYASGQAWAYLQGDVGLKWKSKRLLRSSADKAIFLLLKRAWIFIGPTAAWYLPKSVAMTPSVDG